MRTEEWSVTAWSTWDGAALRPIWGSHCGEASPDPEPGNSKVGCYELYSHAGDDGMAPAAFDDYVSTPHESLTWVVSCEKLSCASRGEASLALLHAASKHCPQQESSLCLSLVLLSRSRS